MTRLVGLLIVGLLMCAGAAWADDLRVVRIVSKSVTLYTDAAASGVVQKFTSDQIIVPSDGLKVASFDEATMMLKITVNGQTGWVEAHRVETNQPPTVAVVCDKRTMPQSNASARNAGERGTCAGKR
ncbi:MAG: hypothetical protein P9C48_05225 [Defluviicoccus sp.]|nr:hypothetical protein [Defluviicoccus sp.]MDG4608517.1 hypothetical protein [Defluviicoccus sp.]